MNLVENISFEERYIALREKENRIYSDEEVSRLPDISQDHPHRKEWMMRKDSMKRLVTYLKKKNQPLKILETGCGNGWLCNQLSKIKNVEVTGLDINSTELKQAERVFKNAQRLKFIYDEIDSDVLAHEKFDVILFAASIQYFKSLKQILNAAFKHLNEKGEIHIIDTHFYKPGHVAEAKKRTQDYFTNIGFSEMIDAYFHHNVEELKEYNYRILYKPSLANKFLKNSNPFPWICIKRN